MWHFFARAAVSSNLLRSLREEFCCLFSRAHYASRQPEPKRMSSWGRQNPDTRLDLCSSPATQTSMTKKMTSPLEKKWRDHTYITSEICSQIFRTKITWLSMLRRVEAECASSRCSDTLEALWSWVTITNLKPHQERRSAGRTRRIALWSLL